MRHAIEDGNYRLGSDEYMRPQRKLVKEYLTGEKCIECDESNIVVLDFHHKNEKNKIEAISELVDKRANLEIIKEEMDKCDILCSNCHHMEHFYKKHLTKSKKTV